MRFELLKVSAITHSVVFVATFANEVGRQAILNKIDEASKIVNKVAPERIDRHVSKITVYINCIDISDGHIYGHLLKQATFILDIVQAEATAQTLHLQATNKAAVAEASVKQLASVGSGSSQSSRKSSNAPRRGPRYRNDQRSWERNH